MSLGPPPGAGPQKRCFAYCGDDRCTCDARPELDMLHSFPFVSAAVLGNRVSGKIPAGEYWLVECHPPEGEPGHPLYWMDDYDSQDRTGFSYIPQYAACFRSEREAQIAWAARGTPWSSKPRVLYVQHAWEDA